MAGAQGPVAARGLVDRRDRLLSADDPLADLHARCGGTLPGTLAVPELLDLVWQARRMGLKIAREFSAFDGVDMVGGLARIHPRAEAEGGGCEVLIENWQTRALPEQTAGDAPEWLDAVDRAAAEVTARLDPLQRIQLLGAVAPDARRLQELVEETPGAVWTDLIECEGAVQRQPLHWRLLDGAPCRLPGSARRWRARLLPLAGQGGAAPRGFELLLLADRPLGPEALARQTGGTEESHAQLIGTTLAPVLRQPIARIIANAETIRARLAGPLRAEYSEYAGNIAAAGQHLAGLIEDLADLAVVTAPGFSTAVEPVDLGDAARRAAGILGVRARARNIDLALPIREGAHVAAGEFRRVLQILINLIGNAIAYSPEHSIVTICAASEEPAGTVSLSVCDEGPGIAVDDAARIFDKYERLGREHDGGSGLGLYIAQRLAEAMGGTLRIANPGEEGAVFVLTLPALSD